MFRRTSVNGPKYIFGDLNSRIHRQVPGEDNVIGDHVFGDPSADLALGSNRELLLECCVEHGLAVASTFLPNIPQEQVTHRAPGVSPLAEINAKLFAQLDLLLVPFGELHTVLQVPSDRSEALASHHFQVRAEISARVETSLAPVADPELTGRA